MLLLSSATRIFATERPPPLRCRCWPHPCVAVQMTYSRLLEHPFQFASISRGQPCVGSEYCTYGPLQRLIFGAKTHGVRSSMTVPRSVSPDLRPAAKPYQGKIFFRPFFFLLVDSFLLSLLDFPSCAAASALAASLVCPAAAGISPVLLGSAGWPVAAGVAGVLGVVSAVPFAEFSVVGGAFGSPVAAGPASPPSVAGVTLSALLVLPGVTVATIPVVVAPCDGLPPLNISIPVSLSESGVIVGFPVVAAARNSCPGPVRIRLSGFSITASRCRGAFCSAVIHATALASGCGIGAPRAFNRLLALGTSGDKG